jgi:putative transposase
MKLSLKYYPRWTKEQRSIITELSFHTTKLYNIANYQCRENQYQSYITLEKQLKSNWHNDYLHSHTYQHCLRIMDQNWKSYFQAIRDYRNNPGKYKGEPQPPGYKHVDKHPNEVVFTQAAIRRRDGQLLLSLSKTMQEKFQVNSLKVKEARTLPLPEQARLQQIRLQYDRTKHDWFMLIIYNIMEKEPSKAPHIMAIDLGLDNLAAITFSRSPDSYLLCGRRLKSVNGYYNKTIAYLQSIRMKQVGPASFRKLQSDQTIKKETTGHHVGCPASSQSNDYQISKAV